MAAKESPEDQVRAEPATVDVIELARNIKSLAIQIEEALAGSDRRHTERRDSDH